MADNDTIKVLETIKAESNDSKVIEAIDDAEAAIKFRERARSLFNDYTDYVYVDDLVMGYIRKELGL